MVVVQLSLDGARIYLVHFRYNVVLDRVVYYSVLFAGYIDGIIDKLECVGLGCWPGDVFVGCILYAKYLGVCLLSGLKFKVSLHYMRCT